ncbi:MAG: hypothetical protein ACLQU1_10635 [Bryobacteraceae bacterium]
MNLSWPAVDNPGYGYRVEVQSEYDVRYSSWTELQPVPGASGYTCDTSIEIRGGHCNMSDPLGLYIHNPPNNGIPYWVTDANYVDPQDATPAQFIVWGLKPHTAYSFRVRAYSGDRDSAFGPYSNTALATTAGYTLRYVSPAGDDRNDGGGPDLRHAWRTLVHASGTIACGQELIVMGGDYPDDALAMAQSCSAANKAVVMVNPGDVATITLTAKGASNAVTLSGNHIVVDGLRSITPTPASDYAVVVSGAFNAVLNIDVHPPVVPTFQGGVYVTGHHNLVYRSTLHDYGSPDAVQDPNGNGGFVLTVLGKNATGNVIWSNHLTRGGHDVSLCKAGCSQNRWLNNIMDGGWGMGFEAISGDGLGADHNLIEGNFIKDVGRLVTFYKPSIEISSSGNTVRRNIILNGARWGLEESALDGPAAQNLIYNNVFYAPTGCIFQSSAGGAGAYNGNLYANNICYKFTDRATEMYPGNKTSTITRNAIVSGDKNGTLQPDEATVVWNKSAGAAFEGAKPLAYADHSYNPPFFRNKGLDVEARFVDETRSDFHLASGSPLIGAGTAVTDSQWGGVAGTVDVGAFGINPSLHPPGGPVTVPAPAPTTATVDAVAMEPGNVLHIGKPQLDRPTLTAIGIVLPISGDDNFNSVVTVRYREKGSGAWRDALPLFRVHPEVVEGWGVQPHFGGSIFGLKPATTYEVELHATDPDGMIDETLTVTGTTRAVPGGPRTPNSKSVRNAQELTEALATARAGDVITLAGGVYSGTFEIKAGGTLENPVVMRGASREGTILDGGGCTGCNVVEVYGSGFVHIENLTIRNAERAIRFQTEGAEGNVVRRVHIRDTTMGIGSHPDQKDFYICDNIAEGRIRWPLNYRVDNGAHSDDTGIQVQGFGHVVCHNQISGYGDAMRTDQRGARAVDFYGNDIRYTYDNALELDEAEGNVRCFRNRYINTYSPLSVQPIFGGPAYIFRNLVINVVDEQMKFHALGGTPPMEPSGVLVFHNTFVSPELALNLQTPAMSHFFVIANNLFVGPKSTGLAPVVDWDGPFHTGVFDYNGYFPDGAFSFNRFHAKVKYFPAFSVLQSYGMETHGTILAQPVFQNGFLLDAKSRTYIEPVDLVPAPNSGAIDRGIYLPNISDGFTGAGPDLGAQESGCPVPIYGPRPESVDESNEETGCPAAQPQTNVTPLPSLQPALALLASVSGGGPNVLPGIAEEALLQAVSGNLDDALGYFNAFNFPETKQDDAVRYAYFELQLQRLLNLAATHQCAPADNAITNLGAEDKSLPFTFFGFGAYARRLRTQYLIGAVEFACVDQKAARKRWEKVAKGTADLASADYAFPYLALSRLNPTTAKEKAALAMETVRKALAGAAAGEARSMLLYHQGLLYLAMDRPEEAAGSFREGGGSNGIARYLNLSVLRTLGEPHF